MAGLIVSVRNWREAEIAAGNGASLVDIKEPRRGSLGRASDRTIHSVVHAISAKVPISAALGELLDRRGPPDCGRLAYVKWGLSGYARKDWPRALVANRDDFRNRWPACRPVVVAYGDWRRARSPLPKALCDFAADRRFSALLLDTWNKDGSTLLDWIGDRELAEIAAYCRSSGVKLALAGSLGPSEILALRPLHPDWFAVRGAVCRQGMRGATLDRLALRRIAGVVAGHTIKAVVES